MAYQISLVLHVISVMMLVAITFQIFAFPEAETRKKNLMLSGIFSLLAFLSGFGILGMQKLGVPGWAIVKVVSWLVVSALGGVAYRRKEAIANFRWLVVLSVIVAVVMAVFKPELF